MNSFTSKPALAQFDTAIAGATTAHEAYSALQSLAEAVVGAKLFTVMTVDMTAGLARRAFTNQPEAYPATGTKPIPYNSWFEVVHTERRPFVANTIEAIAEVFPDHELINSLGCQSVLNLPVVLCDELVATVNLLHETGYYTPERVAAAIRELAVPAKLSCLLARTMAGTTADRQQAATAQGK
jgi:GAF domain-containing protein